MQTPEFVFAIYDKLAKEYFKGCNKNSFYYDSEKGAKGAMSSLGWYNYETEPARYVTNKDERREYMKKYYEIHKFKVIRETE